MNRITIGLSDTRNNYPIFRKGYTSAHPAVDFNDDGIGLVDMACFPGSSGSPIFIFNEGSYRDKHGNVRLRSIYLFNLLVEPSHKFRILDGSHASVDFLQRKSPALCVH